MKKVKMLLLAIVLGIGISSCIKEGPVGPAGPAGTNGTAGIDGTNGTNGT